MPSEKLIRILKAKSPFSDEEIASMTEASGWDWVYANAKPRKERLTQICFTGFSATEKDTLIALARQSHLEVVGTVTQCLWRSCVPERTQGPQSCNAPRNKASASSPESSS